MASTVESNNFKKRSITKMLQQWGDGRPEALDEIMPLVYDELYKQASQFMQRENKAHTLETSALVNEAYLKLIDQRFVKWKNRSHFFAIASQAMRRVLVDYARTKHRQKRGGEDAVRCSLDETSISAKTENTVDIIALDGALMKLAKLDPQQARVVELKFFSGLTLEETAEVLEISRATVAREWNMAKAWLHRELSE